MSIPDYQSIMLPLLHFAGDGKEHRSPDGMTAMAVYFKLTPDELEVLIPSGQDYVFANRWGWARTYLKKAGLIEYPSRGWFRITSAGQQLLSENPPRINVAMLKQYPAFMAFWDGPPHSEPASAASVSSSDATVPDKTPEELVASSHDKLRKQIQSELLTRVMSCSPNYFERLVVKLLTTKGYGGSVADAGKALGKTGDGGVDGEIAEDKLGLERIYIQAKRWGTNNVGSPEVREFIGALAAKRARKGVLITTSNLTAEAKECAKNIDKSVVLINGERLTELMFEYGLGVVTESIYYVKRIDSDFFDQEAS